MGKRGIKVHYLWKGFLIIPIVLLYNVSILMTEGGIDSGVGELLASVLFEPTPVADMNGYIFVIERMYYILIFNMLYGTYLYHDFQVSSIYLFSRLKDRKKWFYKNVTELAGFALLYTFLCLATLFVVGMLGANDPVDGNTVKMLGILLIFVTLFLTATTLVVNLLAIRFNSSAGFFCVYVALLILTAIALKTEQLRLFTERPYLVLFNPLSSIVFNRAEEPNMGWMTTIYYLLLNGVIILLGAKFANSLEVGLLEKENDG